MFATSKFTILVNAFGESAPSSNFLDTGREHLYFELCFVSMGDFAFIFTGRSGRRSVFSYVNTFALLSIRKVGMRNIFCDTISEPYRDNVQIDHIPKFKTPQLDNLVNINESVASERRMGS